MQLIVGLGGNVGSVEASFRKAHERLDSASGLVVENRSTVLVTQAVGPPQPDFLNAALLLSCRIPPIDVLDLCQDIEASAGRNRLKEVRWGPRPLDLDLLIAEDLVCRGRRLELPHPRLTERCFALIPAAELAPGWVHPVRGLTLRNMADALLPTASCVVCNKSDW